MYRALTWKVLKAGVDPADEGSVFEIACRTEIRFKQDNESQQVWCDGYDVTQLIRTPQVGNQVSRVAAIPAVRSLMVQKQREMARSCDVIMDGRDIGEQVMPDADYKFFLTASIEERTRRRIKELQEKGIVVDGDAVRTEIEKRDKMDTEREVGALKVLPESIVIDTSKLSVDELLRKMMAIIGR